MRDHIIKSLPTSVCFKSNKSECISEIAEILYLVDDSEIVELYFTQNFLYRIAILKTKLIYFNILEKGVNDRFGIELDNIPELVQKWRDIKLNSLNK